MKGAVSESVYENLSWICGDEEKNKYFCWPCLVMGGVSTVSKSLSQFSCCIYTYLFCRNSGIASHILPILGFQETTLPY